MSSSCTQLNETEVRGSARTHMFVAAALWAEGESLPVRIRNMSATGALLEGDRIPGAQYRLHLRRGSLNASGRVAWRVGRKAGIAFDEPVEVSSWMANKVSGHQSKIDAAVAKIKAARPITTVALAHVTQGAPCNSLANLMRVRADLLQLADTLSADATVMASYPEIQVLDIALQRLDQVLSELQSASDR